MSPKLQRLPTSFLPLPLSSPRLSGRVRVHLLRIREPTYPQPGGNPPPYLPFAAGSDGDVDEAPRVQLALVGTALGRLGLLLGLNLEWGADSVNRDASGELTGVYRCGMPYLGGLRLDLACAHLLAPVLVPRARPKRMRRRLRAVAYRRGQENRELCPF
jgi:hypothetical protein